VFAAILEPDVVLFEWLWARFDLARLLARDGSCGTPAAASPAASWLAPAETRAFPVNTRILSLLLSALPASG
jgi:hypothetical protein